MGAGGSEAVLMPGKPNGLEGAEEGAEREAEPNANPPPPVCCCANVGLVIGLNAADILRALPLLLRPLIPTVGEPEE